MNAFNVSQNLTINCLRNVCANLNFNAVKISKKYFLLLFLLDLDKNMFFICVINLLCDKIT